MIWRSRAALGELRRNASYILYRIFKSANILILFSIFSTPFFIYIFFFIFSNRLNITRSVQQKYLLTGNLKYFKKISLHPANIKTCRRKNLFDVSIFFFIFFNRLNTTRLGRQKYGMIANVKSFKKMGLHQSNIPTRRQKKISVFNIFSFSFFNNYYYPINCIIELTQLQNEL